MQLNKAIQNRWSPRGFSDKPITGEMIELLFKAARLAPSSRNEQPWNYFYVRRENRKEFDELVDVLTGNNPSWAKDAQVLIISVMKKHLNYNNLPNGKAMHDVGAANFSIAIQAAEMGLQVHQMGGFDREKATGYLKLNPEEYEPVTVIAVGYPAEGKNPSEVQQQRQKQHMLRKDLSEFVFEISGNEE